MLRLSVAALTLALVPVAGRAEPSVHSAPPVSTLLWANIGRQGPWMVTLGAARDRLATPGRGQVCISADRWVFSRNSKTRISEIGCGPIDGYTFDMVGWIATLDGPVETTRRVERYVRSGRGWKRAPADEAASTAVLDVTFTGRGEETRTSSVSQPRVGSCYMMPPVCASPPWVHLRAIRAAEVTGSIRFNGVDLTARAPATGTMHWSH